MQYIPPSEPLFSQVQRIDEGIKAANDAAEIRERIAREIGQVAVQGTSQRY